MRPATSRMRRPGSLARAETASGPGVNELLQAGGKQVIIPS